MTPIDKFLEIIKKHGAVGVLALWLGYTHFEVQDLKNRLFNCLERKITFVDTEFNNKTNIYAILPEKFKYVKRKKLHG
jgi:hypothetical protein